MSENIFTPTQVKNLDEFQRAGAMHPFTCPNRSDGNHFDNDVDLGCLIPTVRGWICQCCDYTQDWAHDFMFDGSATKSFEDLQRELLNLDIPYVKLDD